MFACCVSGCKNRHSSSSKLRFYRIPSGQRPFQANRRRLWLQALQAANGSGDKLRGNVRVCGAHFISGEASMDHDSPDFVPSVFTRTKPSPKKKAKRLYGRRRRRRRKTNTEKDPTGLRSAVVMETEHELSEEIQTLSTPSAPKEGESFTKEAETETRPETVKAQTASSPNKTCWPFKAAADRMNPVVLLKPLVAPTGWFQCELCSQKMSSVPQLVKHIQLHEEERVFICENCGKQFTSQATFTEHQRFHSGELPFPCSMCERSFPTSKSLKRHKLLHVRDSRKCSTCGVMLCQRHKHISFLPQAVSVTEADSDSPEPGSCEEDSSIVELQNEGSDVTPGKGLLQSSVQSHADDPADSAHGTTTVTPVQTTTVPTPPGALSKTSRAPPPASQTTVLPGIPVGVWPSPSSVPCPPPKVHKYSRNPGTSSQRKPPPTDYPATFFQPPPPQELPSSLKIFSPRYLTSALLEVKRNYEYIFSKPRGVKKEIVKQEKSELPLISREEKSVERDKKERVAYDMEIVV